MMIQTVNPRRTAEIMARYRPIAPKPEVPPPAGGDADGGGITCKSPYLRNVWPHLQARPTRTRKRTRAASFSSAKRQQHHRAARDENGIAVLPLLGDDARIDLNAAAAAPAPEELDFLQQLQQPLKQPVIISPRPVRPVGSTIIVSKIVSEGRPGGVTVVNEAADEVEAMVEAEHVPAVISDASNKVRMVNSAYKEMIGQPECG